MMFTFLSFLYVGILLHSRRMFYLPIPGSLCRDLSSHNNGALGLESSFVCIAQDNCYQVHRLLIHIFYSGMVSPFFQIVLLSLTRRNNKYSYNSPPCLIYQLCRPPHQNTFAELPFCFCLRKYSNTHPYIPLQ